MINKEYRKDYYLKNKKYCKNYYLKHRDKILIRQKKYQQDNKEKIIDYKKKYSLENKDKIKQASKIYYEKNKKKIDKRNKEYQQTHKKERREYLNNRYGQDIQFRLGSLLRGRLFRSLKRNTKKASAVEDLGCTLSEFKIYLEKQFKLGMTWENQGLWHIDHKIPLTSFDLTDKEQLLKAVHYTNLQPLWGVDNIRKGNKISI